MTTTWKVLLTQQWNDSATNPISILINAPSMIVTWYSFLHSCCHADFRGLVSARRDSHLFGMPTNRQPE